MVWKKGNYCLTLHPDYYRILVKINPNISRQPKTPLLDIHSLLKKVLEGDRFSLSQAITLIESSRTSDQALAMELIEKLRTLPGTSFRIAISGAPGAGKSTFIEALGYYTISKGFKPAVLAIDPSSQNTQGSILGDKMRMEKLSLAEEAFIRPTPSGDFTGGTAKKTRESLLLLEKAGYNPIFIETVGVGQTETAAHYMTDLFLLLVAPGSGDEIQGIKKGIVEMADFIVINKMDGELALQAQVSLQHYTNALHINQREGQAKVPRICAVSSVLPMGMETLWTHIEQFFQESSGSGEIEKKRRLQELDWFETEIRLGLLNFLKKDPFMVKMYETCREMVKNNEGSAITSARVFFEKLGKKMKNDIQ